MTMTLLNQKRNIYLDKIYSKHKKAPTYISMQCGEKQNYLDADLKDKSAGLKK